MHASHAPWVRAFLERKFVAVRLWMSTVRDPPETEALRALSDPIIVTEMIDFIMAKLGHGEVPIRGGKIEITEDCKRLSKLRKRLAPPRGMEREEAETV